jgi:ribosomal protein S18 acetylase RimI-like enzyme
MKIKKINRFSLKVFDAILRLFQQLDSNSELPTKTHIEKILKSKNSHFFVVELENDQIVGMLTMGTYNTPSGIKVWIEDVVVDETQRGKGLGIALTLYAIDFAKTIGADAIELTSRPSRIAANKMYQKIGFIKRETNIYKYLVK